MKRIKAVLIFALLLGVLGLSGCGGSKTVVMRENAETGEEPDKAPELLEGGALQLSINYGYDKYVKSGRYMRVLADITNNGKDFSGSLQLIIPDTENNRYMYQKEVALAAGETKRVEMAVPVSGAMYYHFLLVDKNEKVMAKKSARAYISTQDELFTGILTDDTQSLAYFAGDRMKSFYLDADTFPEEVLGLDTLDIIVINDFNTEKLNEKQYTALKEFVMRGGTLVLGTGSTGTKTMAAFKDSFLNGTMGSVEKKMISYGLDEENVLGAAIEKDIMDIHLENAIPLVKESGTVLVEKLDKGSGAVLLSTMDLGLSTAAWDKTGAAIRKLVSANISPARQALVQSELDGRTYSYMWHRATDLVDNEKIPSAGRYVAVLLIYLLVIGPPLYFILKKFDKRNFTWFLVPVFSALFATFIYGIGGETRQDEPYLGYAMINTIENGIENKETYFGITVPYNNRYEMDFSGMGAITPDVERATYYNQAASDRKDNLDYNVAVKYNGDKTKIEIKDSAAFTASYFKTQKSSPTERNLESSLRLKDTGLTGTVTNTLGLDLKRTALYAYGAVYPLGDFAQGETISVDEIKRLLIQSDRFSDDAIARLAGGDPYGNRKTKDIDKSRWFYIYEYYLSRMEGNLSKDCYLLGFSKDEKLTLPKGNDMESSGATMFVIRLPIALEAEGKTFIPRLDSYIQNVEGNWNRLYNTVGEQNVRMDIQFDKEDKITELIYSELYNREVGANYWEGGFKGEIKAYNYVSGDYETIFTEGLERRIPVGNYIDADNRMKLLIVVDETLLSQNGIADMPVLSAVKEDK